MNPQQPTTYPLPNPKGSKQTLVEVILGVLLIASLGFGVWAYIGKADLQKNTNSKIDTAVAAAKTAQATALQAQFAEQSKSPNSTYTGSATYGTITFNYPKTWSVYTDLSSADQPINTYFNPIQVPSTQQIGAVYALRLELVSTPYADVITSLQSSVTTGALTAVAYVPPKLKGVTNVQIGTKFDGPISQTVKTNGSMVVMKVRDKTLKVYTLSPDYLNDFNNTVLSSLTFAP